MPEFISGPTMIMSFSGTAGTSTLNADYKTCTWTPSVAYVESSAGQDTHIGRLTALKDSKAAVTLVAQATTGTALTPTIAAGVFGTLVIQPEGTAVGRRKISMPGYSDGPVVDFPYNDICVISCGFTGSGAFTDGTN
jgi:hypothetical protein